MCTYFSLSLEGEGWGEGEQAAPVHRRVAATPYPAYERQTPHIKSL